MPATICGVCATWASAPPYTGAGHRHGCLIWEGAAATRSWSRAQPSTLHLKTSGRHAICDVLRPQQALRDLAWAQGALACIDDAAYGRIELCSRNCAWQHILDNIWRSVVPPVTAPALPRSKLEQRASRLAPDTNEPCSLQTHQQSPGGHRVPLLSAAKCWHLPSVQFPRHRIVAHIPSCPNFSNDLRQRGARRLANTMCDNAPGALPLGRETGFAKV